MTNLGKLRQIKATEMAKELGGKYQYGLPPCIFCNGHIDNTTGCELSIEHYLRCKAKDKKEIEIEQQKIVNAYRKGKRVEVCHRGCWELVDNPEYFFDFTYRKYRVVDDNKAEKNTKQRIVVKPEDFANRVEARKVEKP